MVIIMIQIKKKIKNYLGYKLVELKWSSNVFDYYSNARQKWYTSFCRSLQSTYGLRYLLEKYGGYKKHLNIEVEHFPGTYQLKNISEYKDNDACALFVCSNNRAEFLKKYTNKLIFDIGPSIAYAKNIYSDFELRAIKRVLGKTLCIYPTHSLSSTEWEKKDAEFIKYVKQIRDQYNYDTVLVSMYYVGINRGEHIKYQKEGFVIVSAGHSLNFDFNDLMRTIIQLSDYVVFQSYASAVGYCIYFNVPLTLYKQDEMKYIVDKGSEREAVSEEKVNDILIQLYNTFSNYDESISEAKRDLCNNIYGYESIKSQSEILNILSFLEGTSITDTEIKLRKKARKAKFGLARRYIIEAINRKYTYEEN